MKKNVQKKKTTAESKTVATSKNVTKSKYFPFLFLGVSFILLHVYLSFAPEVERAWGLNFVRFFDWKAIIFFYIMSAVVIVPSVNKKITGLAIAFSKEKFAAFLKKNKVAFFILTAIISVIIFQKLQIKYVLLGDLDIRVKQIEKGEIMNDEFLTMQMFKYLYILLHGQFAWTGVQIVRLFSYISGGLFILTSLFAADAIGKNFLQKLSYFIISTLSLGALMQFCGYLEMYALALLLLQVYICLCIFCLQGKVNIIFPVLTLAVGIAAHLMLVAMLPSLIFLIYRNLLWKYPVFRKKSTFCILAIVAFPFVYYALTTVATRVLLPFSPGEKDFMTMFSMAHYKEFINSQLLAGGFVFIVWIATVLYFIFKKIRFSALHWFFLISSLSMTGLLFVFNALRGSGDWDILSFGAVVTNAMTAFLLLDLHNRKIIKNIRYGICMTSVFAILHTSFWIITNDSDISIGWLKKAIEKDPAGYYKGSFSNESLLGAVFDANNLNEEALYYQKISYLKHRNDPRTGYNYAGQLHRNNQIQEATAIYEDLVKNFPFYALPYKALVGIYMQSQNYPALHTLLTKMQTAYNQSPEAFTSRIPQEEINAYFDILRQFQ